MSDPIGYGQFCPVSMTSEILCNRWTTLVVRELLCGSTRFNDLRRGLPRMSPSLLSKRLKQLEKAGIVKTKRNDAKIVEYHLSEAGEELRPLIIGMGNWGQRWVQSELSMRNLDPSLLMWDMRRNLRPEPMPPSRCTIQFTYPELPNSTRHWWMIVEKSKVDLCGFDPGYEIDLIVTTSLRDMTAIWMGHADIQSELKAGRLALDGHQTLASTIEQWIGLSVFADQERKVS